MKQMIDLTGKKILVTGASGEIGRAIAILLSQLGAKMTLVARNEEKVKRTISLMENSDNHDYDLLDLCQLEQIEPLMKKSVEKDGRKFDGLVHCAGISHVLPLKLISYEKQHEEMCINYYAYIELVKQISKRRYGTSECSIVGVSSIAAHRGGKCQTIYSAAKGAMDAATIPLSKELAERGIRINTVRPGMIKTNMMMGYAEKRSIPEEELRKMQHLGLGLPEDVAYLVAFLLSSASRFITGQSISVDGGGPVEGL